MILPKLDNRSVEDILALIREKREFYTPEWNFDSDNPDGGAALAKLFAEMFYGTIDRYNRFPDKCFLEFLNMTGVCAKSVTPAVGMACVKLVDGASESVYVKKGTQLFCDISDENDGEKRVVFETESPVVATPANLSHIFMTDPENDVISVTDFTDPENENVFPIKLLHPAQDKNIERHCFAVAHSAVLRLVHSSEIYVKISNSSTSFTDSERLEVLCNPEFARWSFITPHGREYLNAEPMTGFIKLTKAYGEVQLTDFDGNSPEDEELYPWLFCEMKKTSFCQDMVADSVSVSCRSLSDEETGMALLPDHLFANDTELSTTVCGYCFGRDPAPYDAFYISCGEAFGKSGAEISMQLVIDTVTVRDSNLSDEDAQEFDSKLIVDKEDTIRPDYDDIFVSEVMWEYWNGYGWSRLEVLGDTNPFSCKGEPGRKTLRFICPQDFAVSVQNAHEGFWLRARVLNVENRFSVRANKLLPLLKSIAISFDYSGRFLPADKITVLNSCSRTDYAMGTTRTPMPLFRLMPDTHRTVYFCFDKAPSGYPLNIYFGFEGSCDEGRAIVFEYLSAEMNGRWNEMKFTDRTEGFRDSGIVSLYSPKDFIETELFGKRGYWIRAVSLRDSDAAPKLSCLVMNAVDITQRESVFDEQHTTPAGRKNSTITLERKPVISCDLWINELADTPLSELQQLHRESKERVRMITDDEGLVTECWVKWEPRSVLSDSGADDRHYAIDFSTGEIRFGDGVNGRIPTYSDDAQISADYSFGGGSAGNIPAGTIDGLIVGIPFVDKMTNFEPTCGGGDGQSLDEIRRLGPERLKYGGRAITADSFEGLVSEEFTEAAEVRCFSNRNRSGEAANGYTTVVVRPADTVSPTYSRRLCRRILNFLSERAAFGLVAGNRLAVIPAKIMRVSTDVTLFPEDYNIAAQTEREVISVISELIKRSCRIGVMPTESAVLAAVRGVENVAYVSRVMLTGEYSENGETFVVPLNDSADFRYFVAISGTHTVKL